MDCALINGCVVLVAHAAAAGAKVNGCVATPLLPQVQVGLRLASDRCDTLTITCVFMLIT